MKKFNGKAIYNPAGKAGEYAEWACNFYVGCSNGCEYCYLKKGRGANILGGCKPTLKKSFKDGADALRIFQHEVYVNRDELRKHGLFFSFTTDPLLPENYGLTWNAISICNTQKVPVKVLTKRADGALKFLMHIPELQQKNIAIGFTLTGHDELEPNASTNAERIKAMITLHNAGYKTFASIEPIIDFDSSLEMIQQTRGYCDLYKIGLMAGLKVDVHFKGRLRNFCRIVVNSLAHFPVKVYWKESISKHTYMVPDAWCNVDRDYNMFDN